MKRLIKILVVLLFIISTARAQDIKDLKVDLKLTDVEFSEFARELKSGYNITIYYLPGWVDNVRITINEEMSLGLLLGTLLEPHGINYTIKGRQVFLTGDISLDEAMLRVVKVYLE